MRFRNLFLVAYLMTLNGCNIFATNEAYEYDRRIVLKTIRLDDNTALEMYHYSLITSYSPTFIDIRTNGGKHETVCSSTYISDINFASDSLTIQLWANDTPEVVKPRLYELEINFDTTGRQPNY